MDKQVNLIIKPNNTLHDNLAEEIISEQPTRIEKKFLWILLGCIFIVLILSWFIKYPDTLKASTQLTSANPPTKVILAYVGKIEKIYAHENEIINKGQKIFELDSDADKHQVHLLESEIDKLILEKCSESQISQFLKSSNQFENLGELQFPYLELLINLKKALKTKIDAKFQLIKLVLTFKRKLDQWNNRYIIRSPFNGRLNYLSPISENEFIGTARIIAYITPLKKDLHFVLFLPQSEISQIKKGMKVSITLDAYPEQEYGNIQGKISNIYLVPDSNIIKANILLSNGMNTDKNKVLRPYYGLRGKAQILIKDERIFNRIIGSLFYKN